MAMMNGGMHMGFGAMFLLIALLAVVLVLGFAYIIWILAEKEDKKLKLVWQIIAGVISVIVIILLIVGTTSGFYNKNYRMNYKKTCNPAMMHNTNMPMNQNQNNTEDCPVLK